MPAGIIWLLSVALFFGIFFFAMLIRIYNGLVELRQQVDRAWANIDVILEQRHEEIPTLISICEQFVTYERSTLDRLVKARERYSSLRNVSDKIQTENEISESLQTIIAIGEGYPQLQSNMQFIQLQTRISSLENALADRKEFVNETVTNFNTRRQQIPELVFAGMMGYGHMPLYLVPDAKKTAPSVKMQLPSA